MPTIFETVNSALRFSNLLYTHATFELIQAQHACHMADIRYRRYRDTALFMSRMTYIQISTFVKAVWLRCKTLAHIYFLKTQYKCLYTANSPVVIVSESLSLAKNIITAHVINTNEKLEISAITQLQQNYINTNDNDTVSLAQETNIYTDYIDLHRKGKAMFMEVAQLNAQQEQSALERHTICGLLHGGHSATMFIKVFIEPQERMLHKDSITTMCALYNLAQEKSELIRQRVSHKLYHYVHLNESLQLLLLLHVEDSTTQYAQIAQALQKYIENYNDIHAQCTVQHNDKEAHIHFVRDMQAHTLVSEKIIRVTQLLVAAEAINDIYRIAQQEFNALHNKHEQYVVQNGIISRMFTIDICYARLSQILQLHYMHTILQQYILNTQNILHIAPQQNIDSHNSLKILTAILQNFDDIIGDVTTELQVQVYVGVVHCLVYNSLKLDEYHVWRIQHSANATYICDTIATEAIKHTMSPEVLVTIIQNRIHALQTDDTTRLIEHIATAQIQQYFIKQMQQYAVYLVRNAHNNAQLVNCMQHIQAIQAPQATMLQVYALQMPDVSAQLQYQHRSQIVRIIRSGMSAHNSLPKRVEAICAQFDTDNSDLTLLNNACSITDGCKTHTTHALLHIATQATRSYISFVILSKCAQFTRKVIDAYLYLYIQAVSI